MSKIPGYVGAFYASRMNSLCFDGTGDKVVVADASELEFSATDDFTLEMWFRSTADGMLFNKYNASDLGYKLEVSSNKLVFTIGDDTNTSVITGSTNVNDGKWHHVIAVRDHSVNDKIYLYLDGSSDATAVEDTTTATLSGNGLDLGLGAVAADASNCLTGNIGETLIYKGLAMSSTNVAARYNNTPSSGKGKIYPDLAQEGFENYLSAHWFIDEGTGSSIIDSSGNGNTGTITNALWKNHKITVTGESVGTGNGTDKTFSLDNPNIDIDNCDIKLDDVVQSKSSYVITPKGSITFNTAPGVGVAITADYDYFIVSQVGGFFNWSLDILVDTPESTDLQSGGWREYEPVLKGWTASAERYWLNKGFYSDLGGLFLVKFFLSKNGNHRYEGWARLAGLHPSVSVDALIDEPIDFQGHKNISFETA